MLAYGLICPLQQSDDFISHPMLGSSSPQFLEGIYLEKISGYFL